MIERRENFRFALEAGEALGIGGHGLGQHLDRHVATQLRVFGPIHLPHAAFTQLVCDLEVGKCRSNHVQVLRS